MSKTDITSVSLSRTPLLTLSPGVGIEDWVREDIKFNFCYIVE